MGSPSEGLRGAQAATILREERLKWPRAYMMPFGDLLVRSECIRTQPRRTEMSPVCRVRKAAESCRAMDHSISAASFTEQSIP